MAIVETLLALMAASIVLLLVARRARLPEAVVLVLGGMALALVPGAPRVELDPELVLAFFLPPLLMASAYRTDLRAFRRDLRPILLLAIGAVGFTTACVAVAGRWLVPDLTWAAAIALGAIVAPPDAVAAGAVLRRLRLPPRIVTVLEGESLINDASALVLYRFAVVAATAGFSHPLEAAGSFLLVALGGVAVGIAVARLSTWATARLDDTLLEICASFLCAFAAYLLAELAHCSGVIAAVTAGFWLGRRSAALKPRTRIAAQAVWEFVEFILNSLVFILIGLQLAGILERLSGRPWRELAEPALALTAVLIVSRFVWVFPATWLPRLIPRIARAEPRPPWGHVAVIAWSGMRGVVSLAAALALPLDFPERDLIVALAFCAILGTLVLQGTTLEWLIRRLGAEEPPRAAGLLPDEAEARRLVAEAQFAVVSARAADPLEGAIAADLLGEFRERATHLGRAAGHPAGAFAAERAGRRSLRLAALEAGRAALEASFRAGTLTAEALTRIEQELDFEELRVRQALGEAPVPPPVTKSKPVRGSLLAGVLRSLSRAGAERGAERH